MNNVYFLSDLHLGAGYIRDPKAHERRIVDFLRSLKGKVTHIYFLGDVLDYWYEYKTVVPRGYVRFFGVLAELVDSGVAITWFTGNHDIWLFDYLRDEIGIEIVDGDMVTAIGGSTFYLAHGDAVGELPVGFRFIRWLFRNKVCQRLYSAIHPRWTVPFAHRWSSHSRCSGTPESPFDAADDQFVKFAVDYNRRHPSETVDYFIFGHRHIVVDEYIAQASARVVILGDWITHFTYARFTDGELFVEKYV